MLSSLHFLSGDHREGDNAQLTTVIADDAVPHDKHVTNKCARVGIPQLHLTDRFTCPHIPDDQGTLSTSHQQSVAEYCQAAAREPSHDQCIEQMTLETLPDAQSIICPQTDDIRRRVGQH